jgi:hypothetical protein
MPNSLYSEILVVICPTFFIQRHYSSGNIPNSLNLDILVVICPTLFIQRYYSSGNTPNSHDDHFGFLECLYVNGEGEGTVRKISLIFWEGIRKVSV